MNAVLESFGMGAWLRESGRRWLRLSVLAVLAALVLGAVGDKGYGPAPLDLLGSWPGYGRGPAAEAAVADHYAFVAIEEGGLLVLDISEPSRPVRVASYPLAGQTHFVRVTGARAYVATKVVRAGGGCESERWRGRLVVLDISKPATPALLGSYTTSREIQSLFVEGNRVYLCDSVDGLHIVDVNDPARPRALSVGKPDGYLGVCALWASGPRLYCVMYDHWDVVDVSQPSSPMLLTSFASETGLPLRGISGLDQSVFVVEGDVGLGGGSEGGCLSVFGPNPAGELVLKGKLEMQTPALNVTVKGPTAYVAAGPAGIVAVDISTPTRLVPMGTSQFPGLALSLEIAGTNAYVAAYHGGLQVLDVHNPLQLTTVSTFDTGLTTWKLRVSANKAYLVSFDTHPAFLTGYEARSRLEILEVKDPTQPTLLATYELANVVMSLDTLGDLVCLGYNQLDRVSGTGKQGIQLLDVSNPTSPVCLSDTEVSPVAADLALRLSGTRAFVASGNGNGLQIFDISNPATPVLMGQTNSFTAYEELRLWGGCAYLASDYGLDVFDVSDPSLPQALGSVGFDYPDRSDCDT